MKTTFDDPTIKTHRKPLDEDKDPYEMLRAAKLDRDEALLLIDASGLCYRAFHTREYLEGYDGERTGVLHGVLSMVRSLCSAANTARWLLVWDGSIADKRAVYPGYKARQDRQRTAEEEAAYLDMREQMKLAKAMLRHLGCPMVAHARCEADDLLGILSWSLFKLLMKPGFSDQFPRKPTQMIIVSDDKDLYQCIGSRCKVWRASAGKLVDEIEFQSVHGFPSQCYPVYKALVGESASGDNIPGVSGIGDATAGKMVSSHGGTLPQLLKAAATMVQDPKCPKVYQNLYREKVNAELSLKLSTIARTVDDLRASWVTDTDGLEDALKLGIKALFQTRRPCPKKAIDHLRNKLGFVKSFDAMMWQRVCGFVIQDEEPATTKKPIDDAMTVLNDIVESGAESGEMRCPACKGGTIKFVNGGPRRIRAVCSTEGCIRFMT